MTFQVTNDPRIGRGLADKRGSRENGLNPGRLELRTRIAHSGNGASNRTGPLARGIEPGVALGFKDAMHADASASNGEALYVRDGNETVRSFEQSLAGLEGAEAAYATSSGMAAIALTLLALLEARGRIVVADGCYHETSDLLTSVLGRFDVEVDSVSIDDDEAINRSLSRIPTLFLVETISNPELRVADLPRLARLAHEHRTLLVVDNTFATPVFCRPIEHGADLVIHSAGKFMAGHSDVSAGVIAGSSDLLARIRRTGRLLGATLGAFDAWLAIRGLKTLYARMAMSAGTARTIAGRLDSHPVVTRVRYPSIRAETGYSKPVLTAGGGAVLAFDLAGGAYAADQFVRKLEWIPFATTVGGSSTIISYPPAATGSHSGSQGVSSHACGTIRLSAGLEAPNDIWADLEQALDSIAPCAAMFAVDHAGSGQ